MRLLELEIKGAVPSKKNSKVKYGLTSIQHRRWHESATAQLLEYKNAGINKCEIQLDFWMPDNRRRDMDNMITSVFDLLKDLQIIKDDSWQVLFLITAEAKGIDRKNPRVEIWIKEMLI